MAKQLLQTDKRTIQFQSSDKFRLTQTADLFKEHDLEAVLQISLSVPSNVTRSGWFHHKNWFNHKRINKEARHT